MRIVSSRSYHFAFWVLGCLVVSGCVSAGRSKLERKVLVQAVRASLPILESYYDANVPVAPTSRSVYPVVSRLPGKSFEFGPKKMPQFTILDDGRWELSPGDYSFPVMTFCLKHSGYSPAKHRYRIAELKGSRSAVLRALHSKTFVNEKYSTRDIQLLSWKIQAGIPYEQLGDRHREMVDVLIPTVKNSISKSFYQGLKERWKILTRVSSDIPSLDEIESDFLEEFGSLGRKLLEIRRANNQLLQVGNDYETYSRNIEVSGVSDQAGGEQNTSWSRISSRVYARFVTDRNYQQWGELQIRVLSGPISEFQLKPFKFFGLVSEAYAKVEGSVVFDPYSLAADPESGAIQPLAFAGVIGAGGVVALDPRMAIAVAALAGILAASQMDWDAAVAALVKYGQESADGVKELVDAIRNVFSKEHDNLEKPVRESGVLKDAKPRGTNKDGSRQYEKEGGKEQLEKDFNKLPGREVPGSSPRRKELPNGDVAVERAQPRDFRASDKPTLEIQPKDSGRGKNKIRIKIRYP